MEKKLFLLDAYALIYRAYYALINAPRLTSKGQNTSAIFGFVNTLDELIKKESPSHIAVCFDPQGKTFRHEEYPEYKAQRDKQPEDITFSVPVIKDIIRAYGIPVIEVDGYEADDVIGTLSRKAEEAGFITYMMTPDKDYGQLVTDSVFMYKPAVRGGDAEIRGPREICDKFGVESPKQVIDLLALEGDAVDNIPGCPGVGPKTAVKLIGEWGSIENMLANTDKIKGALRTRLEDNVDKIRFSYYLATICTHVPMDVDIEKLKRGEINVDRLREIYTDLEFRQFLKRLPGGSPATTARSDENLSKRAPETPSLFDFTVDENGDSVDNMSIHSEHDSYRPEAVDYREITEIGDIERAVSEALKCCRIGVATYAVGEEDMTSRWLGIGVSAGVGKAFYVPLPDFEPMRKRTIEALTPLFNNADTTVVSHDVKRDMLLLRREGETFSTPYFDTAVAHYLVESEMNHSLSRVASAWAAYDTIDFSSDDGKPSKRGAALTPGTEMICMCEAADVTLRLADPLKSAVVEAGQSILMTDIELPLVRVLADMEWTGVRVDVRALGELSRDFAARLEEMEQEAYRLAGESFNTASPAQVGEILFGKLQLDPKAKRTKKGSFSTTEEVLDRYRDDHPLVGLILDIRGLRKLLSTYVNALPDLINRTTGRIHTTFNQTVTATGRISSANPNLQNIPIRSDDGREIRRAFIPSRGNLMLSADYSQIELRVIADVSHDPDMTASFRDGIDIHRATAAKIYHENLEDVTEEQRRRAKTANFGIIYGISSFGLSQRLHIPRAEAKMLIDGYFASYPHIREYISATIENARATGYVTTIMGRRRMIPEINSRSAVM
ncbi:MAG: DNA polymerase I, partial [Muribaculum sp.]|nr:DNA polymerase I [Muribaculum sp.]